MWDIEQLKIKKKKCLRKQKFKILSLKPHTQKLLTLTGILWLKYMSTTYYKHFTL